MKNNFGLISNSDCIKASRAQNEQVFGVFMEFLKDFEDHERQVLISLFATLEFEKIKN